MEDPPPVTPQAPAGRALHRGGERTWTEAHVGDPSLLAQGIGGYRTRPTVECGSPHKAAGVRTHNHRPTGHARVAPARGPHNAQYMTHTERIDGDRMGYTEWFVVSA